MEAEVRQIIKDSLANPGEEQPELNPAEAIRRRFAPYGGVELEPFPRAPMGPPPEFEE